MPAAEYGKRTIVLIHGKLFYVQVFVFVNCRVSTETGVIALIAILIVVFQPWVNSAGASRNYCVNRWQDIGSTWEERGVLTIRPRI